jgi:hypothetical protein
MDPGMANFCSLQLLVSTGAMLNLGRIYALTMLYVLNYRGSLHGSTDTTNVISLEGSRTLNVNITSGIREYLPCGRNVHQNLSQKSDH